MDLRQLVVAITAACFLGLGLQSTASAGIIGTQDYLAAETRAGHLAEINTALSRADVQAQLVALGVDPADAVTRAAALSDTELARVAEQMQTLPAGGDSLLAVIGILFVVLLILELTGVTDIFKKI
ncbi:MAG: PA2779 family protein [Gammaproteobacteria bacterium]|nr:PA2779 family protein [Gammaproteobacteria bacterium]